MTSIEQMIVDFCNTFNSSSHSVGVKYIPEFPGKKQDIPLNGPVVSVGAERINVSTDTAEKLQVDNSPCFARFKFLICVPKSLSGRECYAVFDKLIKVTESLISKYSLSSIITEEMKYSSTINGLVLPVLITVKLGNAYTKK